MRKLQSSKIRKNIKKAGCTVTSFSSGQNYDWFQFWMNESDIAMVMSRRCWCLNQHRLVAGSGY